MSPDCYWCIDLHPRADAVFLSTCLWTNSQISWNYSQTGLIIMGDFNIHCGKAGNKDSHDFCDLLHSTNLQQHVRDPTHTIGNILDLVMSPSTGCVVTSVEVGSLLTDHRAVHRLLQAPKPDRKRNHVSYRNCNCCN